MGLRDRRRGSQNVAAKIQPSGRAAMPVDQRMDSRNQSDSPSGNHATVHRGRVVHSLAQFGWHQIVLDNGSIMPAEPTGHADKWGTQSVHVYQPGTQVMCAVSWQSNRCTVLAQIPDIIGDRNDQYVLASSVGSKVNLEKDPSAQVFLDSIKENDDTSAYEINPKSDQIAGDWGCRTNTGIEVTVDSFGINMAVDDVTGLAFDLLAQDFNLSGRSGVIETDLFRLSNRVDAYSSQFSMGTAWLQDAYDKVKEHPIDSDTTESGLKYEQYNMLRPYNIIVIGSELQNLRAHYAPDWVAETLQDPRHYDPKYKRDYIYPSVKYSVVDRLLQTGRNLTFMPTELFTVETLMPGYKFGAEEKNAHDQIVARIHKLKPADGNSLPATNMPLGPHTGVLASLAQLRDAYTDIKKTVGDTAPSPDYLFTDRHEVGLLYKTSNDKFEAEEAHSAALENESILVSGQITYHDVIFNRKKLTQGSDGVMQRRDLRSIVQLDELTGDISLINEHGAGIRIAGNTVFIEGGNIRIVSQKDVRVLGRDVTLSSNRNITLSSNNHTRVYAAVNLAMIAGSGGEGGVLIESRGANQTVELPADAEDARYTGITVKSTKAPITALGGDILLRAGDYMSGVAGSLLMTSDGGDALLSSRSRVVLHSTVERLDTFGAEYTKPTSSHMYTAEHVSFKGTLVAGQIWSQGSVVARSDVQAVTGRVADAYGQLVGKVRVPGVLLGSLQALSQIRDKSLQTWTYQAEKIKEEFQGNGRILNRLITSEMSSGYVKAEKAAKHYGTGGIADTIPHLYRDALSIPTDPFRVHMVDYKPGSAGASKTYAYPGRSSVKVRCMAQSPLVVKIASAEQWDEQMAKMEEKPFEEVFGTIQDKSE